MPRGFLLDMHYTTKAAERIGTPFEPPSFLHLPDYTASDSDVKLKSFARIDGMT